MYILYIYYKTLMNPYYQVNVHGPVSQHRVWNGVEGDDSVGSVGETEVWLEMKA